MNYLVWVNGEYVPRDEAKISIKDRGFKLGDVVFDTSRTFNGKVFRLRDHLERLYRSLIYTRIDPGMTMDEIVHVSSFHQRPPSHLYKIFSGSYDPVVETK